MCRVISKNIIIAIVVYLVIASILATWHGVIKRATNNENTSKLTTEVTPTNVIPETNIGMMVEDNAIAASAQTNSNNATASMVVLTKPGFVVIHEDGNGKPGAIIGTSTILKAGKSDNVKIKLSRKTVKGEMLYAMLHTDNGDGLYTEVDLPVNGKNREPIMMNVVVDDSESPKDISL
ncbi:hypothetical protein BH11PAT1_BH11PAT1_5170 [soil metagenome]